MLILFLLQSGNLLATPNSRFYDIAKADVTTTYFSKISAHSVQYFSGDEVGEKNTCFFKIQQNPRCTKQTIM